MGGGEVAIAEVSTWPAATGGVPHWVMEAEYAPGEGEFLLLQLGAGHVFEALPGEPGQTTSFGTQAKTFDLFSGNELYVFAHATRPVAQVVVQKR